MLSPLLFFRTHSAQQCTFLLTLRLLRLCSVSGCGRVQSGYHLCAPCASSYAVPSRQIAFTLVLLRPRKKRKRKNLSSVLRELEPSALGDITTVPSKGLASQVPLNNLSSSLCGKEIPLPPRPPVSLPAPPKLKLNKTAPLGSSFPLPPGFEPTKEDYRALLLDLLLYRSDTLQPICEALKAERIQLESLKANLDSQVNRLAEIRDEIRTMLEMARAEDAAELKEALRLLRLRKEDDDPRVGNDKEEKKKKGADLRF